MIFKIGNRLSFHMMCLFTTCECNLQSTEVEAWYECDWSHSVSVIGKFLIVANETAKSKALQSSSNVHSWQLMVPESARIAQARCANIPDRSDVDIITQKSWYMSSDFILLTWSGCNWHAAAAVACTRRSQLQRCHEVPGTSPQYCLRVLGRCHAVTHSIRICILTLWPSLACPVSQPLKSSCALLVILITDIRRQNKWKYHRRVEGVEHTQILFAHVKWNKLNYNTLVNTLH